MKKLKQYCNRHFGIWNGMTKKFISGIDEPTPKLAKRKHFERVGYDSYKWRYEPKELPKEKRLRENDNIVYVDVE